MQMIGAEDVDQALMLGLTLLESEGIKETTRAGEALVMPCPVMTTNYNPMRRVSFSPIRDANPFFHLMEALWMLAGRNDITWLDNFVIDYSKRFGEPDGTMHGAYGFRWRQHFDMEGGGGLWVGGSRHRNLPDQLETVVHLLTVNPSDRQVVIAMWDPVADLGASDKKDRPCNTHIYPRIRKEWSNPVYPAPDGGLDVEVFPDGKSVLDLTVCCRSNDAIWGCHGANAVHFSVLQEYLAARIGVNIGTLYQLSNNYHAYTEPMRKIWPAMRAEPRAGFYDNMPVTGIVTKPDAFDQDLRLFFSDRWRDKPYDNSFFYRAAIPMRRAYALWRDGQFQDARAVMHTASVCDWTLAALSWMERRIMRAAGVRKEF